MRDEMKLALVRLLRAHAVQIAGALAGLVVAILFLTIGFFKTVLILLCVAGGAVLGTWLTNRRSVIDMLSEIYKDEF